ncbi:hypothetical protein Q8A73_008104 [Channa argus]|nr:hypothetical protein Q8A73_008104 [Channa argus]
MSLKTCSLAEDCIGGSINYGAYRTAVTTKCCTTELCNNQPPADPNRSKPNGKKCFTCNNQTCTAALDCEGDEDYCISATDLLTFWCGPSNGQLHNSGHYGRQTPSFSEPDATRENHIILGLEVAGNHHRGLSEGTESERNISIQTVGHCKE